MNDSGKRRRHEGRTVDREIRIAAAPEDVWDAWARADRIDQWFVDRAEGDMAEGRRVTWVWKSPGQSVPIDVYAAERGRYLAFGAEREGRPAALQELFLRSEGGVTVLRVVNSGFGDDASWDDEYEGVDSGWAIALATLRHWLESRPPGARVSHFAMAPARFEYAAVQPAFVTAEGLESWLVRSARLSGPELAEGAGVDLRFGDGTSSSGTVAARSPREVLLTWPERRGLLALKCFPAGPAGRFLGLHFTGWGTSEAELAGVRGLLEAALERLRSRFPRD